MSGFCLNRQKCFIEMMRESSVTIVWWILLFMFVTFLCYTHIYNDILITAKASYNLWDYFFSGKPELYYNMPRLIPGEYYIVEQSGKYPILLNLVMSIWLFPMWIVGKLVGYNIYNTMLTLTWLKSWLLLSYLLSGLKIYEIIKRFRSRKDAANTSFIFYSCVLVLLNTFIVSQVEIFTCLMMLYGIEAWLDHRNKLFILFFTIAVGMKYFALLAFLPFLLIREKDIYKIVFYTCIVAVTAIEIIIPQAGSTATGMASKFFHGSFIFAVLMSLILAYRYKNKSDEDDFMYVIFIELIIWGAFCLLANSHPYWSVLMVPFLSLAIGTSLYKKNSLIIMELLVSGLLSFLYFSKFYWVYDVRTELEIGILPWMLGLNIAPTGEVLGYHSVLELLSKCNIINGTIIRLANIIAILSMVGFIFLVWKNNNHHNLQLEGRDNLLYICRFLINVVIGGLPVYAFLLFYL